MEKRFSGAAILRSKKIRKITREIGLGHTSSTLSEMSDDDFELMVFDSFAEEIIEKLTGQSDASEDELDFWLS